MKLSERIKAFAELGRQIAAQKDTLLDLCGNNTWFTPANVSFALEALVQNLKEESLENWVSSYHFSEEKSPERVGVITAGNLPLVGFHDFLCVLISGNIFVGKLSSKNDALLPAIIRMLIEIENRFEARIELTDSVLSDFDAVIATGSNNSARYFDYYFKEYPHIIRKNRNSAAILTGEETSRDLENLAEDILLYFGLGCRNVSKIYVPQSYDFTLLSESCEKFSSIINHHKYANNYNYQKTLFLMNQTPFVDTGFLIIKESDALHSPISVLHFEYFEDLSQAKQRIDNERDNLQCVLALNDEVYAESIPFGQAQKPVLTDYADGVDTLAFCLQLENLRKVKKS